MNKYKSDVYKSPQAEKLLKDLYVRQLASIPVSYTEETVDTRFGRTHIVIYGNPNGKPVLGFHGGNSTNPYSLRAFVKHVDMEKIRFIVPDTIGNIGFSEDRRVSSSNEDYGKWACDILDSLGYEKIAVFGGSYGGGIALRLATVAPKRIEKLMLIIPSGIANANPLKMMYLAIPTVGYMLRPTSDEKLKKAVMRMSPKVNDDFLEMMKYAILYSKFEMVMPRNAKRTELEGLTAPVYVMAEKYDYLFPGDAVIKRSKEVFTNLVGTELLNFGGHGVFLLDEDTHFKIYDTITDFLSK